MPLRVLICQETLIVRDGLRSILEAEPDIDVVETTDSGFHAIMVIRSDRPDVVVVGIAPRGISGLELVRRLQKENLDEPPRVVVFGMSFSDQMVTDMLRAGANGVLTGEASRDEVLATIRAVARGQTMLAPEVTERLVTWFRQHQIGPRENGRCSCSSPKACPPRTSPKISISASAPYAPTCTGCARSSTSRTGPSSSPSPIAPGSWPRCHAIRSARRRLE